jgi:hypothetical protein
LKEKVAILEQENLNIKKNYEQQIENISDLLDLIMTFNYGKKTQERLNIILNLNGFFL